MSQEMETQLLHSLAGLVQKIGQDCKVFIVYIHTSSPMYLFLKKPKEILDVSLIFL
jgi:hypothetical protein